MTAAGTDGTSARRIALEGAHNFRDLGGYPTIDGRHTRDGRLFRSDALTYLTAQDVTVVDALGLTTILDLRSSDELAFAGRGLLEHSGISYTNLSVHRERPADAPPVVLPTDLSEYYLGWLEDGAPALVAALTFVLDPARHPLVFHCAAGKDRTGVLAAITLELLGVERDTVVADYAATTEILHLILERLRPDPYHADLIDQFPHLYATADAPNIRRFLEGLGARGGARSWAHQVGFTSAQLETFERSLMTE